MRLFFTLLSEKVGLKLNTQKTKIMASDPITSWQIDEETVETVADLGESICMLMCVYYLLAVCLFQFTD